MFNEASLQRPCKASKCTNSLARAILLHTDYQPGSRLITKIFCWPAPARSYNFHYWKKKSVMQHWIMHGTPVCALSKAKKALDSNWESSLSKCPYWMIPVYVKSFGEILIPQQASLSVHAYNYIGTRKGVKRKESTTRLDWGDTTHYVAMHWHGRA